jgi:Zn-dependent M28 family amino/carboxypeptidase
VAYKITTPLFIIIFLLSPLLFGCVQSNPISFDGSKALYYIERQLEFGPRIPGSANSDAMRDFIKNELEISGWIVENQNFIFDQENLTNVIAKSSNSPPKIIIGTHYDTRALSDNELSQSLKQTPVPGANDGASGTAVLLELGRTLSREELDIWFVFFDAEDQGNINNWEWSIGAQYFVNQLNLSPEYVIIIDMIGDANLEIYKENNSTSSLVESIWCEAEKLGYQSYFIQDYKYSIIDDHLPFINKGIPTCLIIDLDYPYWHTTEDSLDKVSGKSLEIIGDVLVSWLSTHTKK